MSIKYLDRRAVITGAVAAAAAASPWHNVSAAPLPPIDLTGLTSGTWLEQVKAQHEAIAATLAELIAEGAHPSAARTAALKQLSYLLTAHGVAEENLLYPRLAFLGLTVASGDLYLEQQFQKIWNSEIDSKSKQGESGAQFLDRVKRLQAAILEHAKEHEEGDYYPKLESKMDAATNASVSAEFRAQFLMVKEP